MPQPDLTETLRKLVRRHGMSLVLHSLADIQVAPEQASLPSRRARNAGNKSSAVDYVAKMALPQGKAEVMTRAARYFEDGIFLPNISDIREFCRIHSFELGKSVSRASSIPRVFTFLAAMDTDQITKMLDDGAFSGPTRLAPIADAIRNRSAECSNTRFSKIAQAESPKTTTMGDRSKNPWT